MAPANLKHQLQPLIRKLESIASVTPTPLATTADTDVRIASLRPTEAARPQPAGVIDHSRR
jgi:hypothetical protein